MPVRDKGPARRFARDYVDARRNAGEYFLFVAALAVTMSLVRSQAAQIASLLVLYSTVIVIAVDMVLLRRRVNRSMQFRRARLPRPQVQRGQSPVRKTR
jgi:hypothetical protein